MNKKTTTGGSSGGGGYRMSWSTPEQVKIDRLEELRQYLRNQFPTARPGFITVLVDALDTHAKKNHDYNGKITEPEPSDFELKGKFFDIRRKYNRLYNAIVTGAEQMVNENLYDTALDLGVYGFLAAEYIRRALTDEEK